MAENRYKRYLGDSSSRFSDRLESAQDKRGASAYITAGIATGLGLFVMKRYGSQIMKHISRGLPKASMMSSLEEAIMSRHYGMQKLKSNLLLEARTKASIRYFGANAAVRDTLVEIAEEGRSRSLFLTAAHKPDELADEIMRRAGRLKMGREELKTQLMESVRLSRTESRELVGRIKSYRKIYDENVLLKRFSANNRGVLGFKPVTVGDVLNKRAAFAFTPEKRFVGNRAINPKGMTYQEGILRSLAKKDRRFEDLVISGGNLLRDPYGNTLDLRKISQGLDKLIEGSGEFHIPFVGISPYDIFGLGKLRDQRGMPALHIFRKGQPQFIFGPHTKDVVGNIDAWRLKEDMVYIGGDLFSIASGKQIASNVRLDPSQWGRTLRTYTAVGGVVGDQAEYAARQAKLGRMTKILDWLDIGRQEQHSFLDKVTNATRKWKNKAWEGTLVQQIQNTSDPVELRNAANRLKKFIHYESRAMPDDLFEDIFLGKINELYGSSLTLSTKEGILEAFQIMATDKSSFLSKHGGEEFRKQWNKYIRDPQLFMQGGRSYSNKFPDATTLGSMFSSSKIIDRSEDVKKMIQQELIEQYNEYISKTPMQIAEEMIGKGRDINTRGLALDFVTGHISADEFKDALASNPLIGGATKEFLESRAPWYEYGPMAPTGEKALADELRGSYLMVRKPYKFDYRDMLSVINGSEVERASARERLGDYFGQFLSGRKNMDRFTSLSMGIFNTPFGRIQEAASYLHLGLGPEHTGSAMSLFSNLILRRYLPAMLGVGMIGYLGWEMGNLLGKEGDELFADSSDSLRQGIAKVRDTLGITQLAKRMRRLTPGSEMIWELPGLHYIDPAMSQQEVADESAGEVPIRKGRWWILGNTPFVGGKVQYYLPSAKRRAYADYKMTDSLYGSEEEYYRNAWFPTPRYPLAPIRHFLTDQYHWEKKHYYDRPYPVTGPISEIEDIPIAGPALSATFGAIIKPPVEMHKEEMAQAYRESIAKLNQSEHEKAEAKEGSDTYAYVQPGGGLRIVTEVGPSGGSGEDISYGFSLDDGKGAYGSTGQGRSAVNSINRSQIGRSLGKNAIGSKVYLPVRNHENVQGNLIDATNPYSISYAGAKTYYGLTEMAGMKGFLLEGITGQPVEDMKIIQSSERMTSYNRAFWDLELGGIGGEGNEIGRRFIPRQRRFQEELDINPIRNTMPSWMPGDNYFINFRKGDPYVKVPRGEARLPGGGYESLYNYHPEEMLIRASSAGKPDTDIIKKLLNVESGPMPDEVEEAMQEGTELHRSYQRKWDRMGILHSAELELYDEGTKSTGHYDAIVYSPKGLQMVDIKTLSKRRWETLQKQGKPFEEHVDQVTIYMHASGIHQGGIFYATRDEIDGKVQEAFYPFKFDNGRYKRIVEKFDRIRATVRDLIDSGKVSEFELYDPLHRFLILADVAPYSQEYSYYSKYVTREYGSLTGVTGPEREEKERIQDLIARTKKRVSEIKKQHRFFPYRFKDLDIVKEKVHVTDVLGNGMFLTSEYPGRPIEFGGINIPDSRDASDARKFLERFIHPGASVTIGIDKYSSERVSNNNLGTMKAVVFAGNRNLNLRMMQAGIAKENEKDWSPVGIRSRFSGPEIFFGSMWESFAHLDTPFHCVAPWTEVITKDGIKRADEVTKGDMVLTHKGNFKQVVDMRPQSIGKRIVDIKLSSSNIPITVTDDHPMLACKSVRKKRITSHGSGQKLEPYGANPKIEFVHAGDLKSYDYLVYKPRIMSKQENSIIDIASLNSRFVVANERVYTKLSNGKPSMTRSSMPQRLTMSNELARLLGYYAAEGCISKNRDRLAYTIFTFSADEKEYIDDVCCLVEQIFGVKARVKKSDSVCQIIVGSVFLAEIVSYYVGHKTKKRAPEELLSNDQFRAEFIRGLFRGDATKRGYARFDTIGMSAANILLWVRDALFNLWRIPASFAIDVNRENTLYLLRIGKYEQLAVFIDGYDCYAPCDFAQATQTRTRCAVGEYIFYRINNITESEYQLATIDIEVEDDDTFSTVNAAVHNTKFLHVSSPLEEYKRRDVFGKSFQRWSIKDQIVPAFQGIMSKDMFSAALSGGILGMLVYGRSWEKRLLGAKVGAIGFAALSAIRGIGEGFTGKRWIPERRKKEREINEYFDILEYVKYRGLYEYAEKRSKEEGFDIDQFYDRLRKKQETTGRIREAIDSLKKEIRVKTLSERYKAIGKYDEHVEKVREQRDREISSIKEKRDKQLDKISTRWDKIRSKTPRWMHGGFDRMEASAIEKTKIYFDELEDKKRNFWRERDEFRYTYQKDKRIRRLNKRLEKISQDKDLVEIPDWAAIAMQYRQKYQSTLYGADSYGGISQIMGALPPKEREYFAEFIKARPSERKEILELVPDNQRRFLQAAWGMEPDERPSLQEYFKTHYLPSSKWEGWSDTKDINDIKIKVIKNEGLELSEFGFWKNDSAKAEENQAPSIDINRNNRSIDIGRSLRETLEGIGLRDVDVQIQNTNTPGIQMEVHIAKDRRQEMTEFVNNNLDSLL
jgi:tetratricopeptide (TPR) repeat protein